MSKRHALLETTKNLLARRGYQAVSPRMIIDESGAGQGSLYHHFSGKAELAGAALEELSSEMCAEFDALLAGTDDAMESLGAFLEIQRDALGGCRVGRLAHEEAIDLPEIRGPVADYFSHIEDRLEIEVKRAVAQGTFPPGTDPAEIAAALAAVVQGGYVLARAHQNPTAMTRALRGVAVMLHALEQD